MSAGWGGDQREARRVVLGVPLFPDLERALIAKFGPTAEAIMLHQFCYWFTKEKMQDRWSLYLTYKDWREQRGLNRKQVDKGRARLKPTGIVRETKGNYKRLHYALDWVRLAERLSLPLKGVQSASDTPKGGTVETATAKGGTVRTAPPPEVSPETETPHRNGLDDWPEDDHGGVQFNAGDYAAEYAGDYPTGEFPLQGGADGSTSHAASPEQEDEERPPSSLDNVPHRPTEPRETATPPELSPEEKNRAFGEIYGLRGDGRVMHLCEQYRDGEAITIERIAEEIRRRVGEEGSIESHAAYVEYCLAGEKAETAV